MKKLNKKGFTLVELLAVIVILGVIMLIAIPSVGTIISNSRKNSFVSSGKMYISTMQNYMAEKMDDSSYCINVTELNDSKTADKSPINNEEIAGFVIYDGTTYKAHINDGENYAIVDKNSDKSVVKKAADKDTNYKATCPAGYKTSFDTTTE